MATDMMRVFSVLFVDCWGFLGIQFPMFDVSIGQVLIWCSIAIFGLQLFHFLLRRGSVGSDSDSKK